MNNDSRFDLDLKFGQEIECRFKRAMEGTVEVKAERGLWVDTGNIAIEYESRGSPSGIMVTQAKHWTQALLINDKPYCYLTFETDILKSLLRDNILRQTSGGDNNSSRLFLLPIKDVVGGMAYAYRRTTLETGP